MMTIAKFPSLSDGDVHESRTFHSFHGSVSASASQQHFASVQSLTLASGQKLLAEDEENEWQLRAAPGSERAKRAAPRFSATNSELADVAGTQKNESESEDPVLHAVHEKRSTEIIL